MVTGNKQRSITSHPRYCEAAAGGSCHVRTGGAGTRAVGDGAVQKNREFPTRVGSALWFRVFPWAGLTGWAAPHDDIVPSYRDPHMAKFRESRPSEARPATKTPAGSCLDDRAACKATGWAGWEQQLRVLRESTPGARMSRIGTRRPIHMWPRHACASCVPAQTTPLAAGEMGREGAIPRQRQLDSRSRGPALPTGQ